MHVYQIIFGRNGVKDIQFVHKIMPYEPTKGLGLRAIKMAPNKQYLLGGYCDQKCRMISALSWKEVFPFDHSVLELNEGNTSPDVNIYVESETLEDGPLYEAVGRPFKIDRLSTAVVSVIQKDTDLPRVGVSKIAVSHDSCFLATVNEQCPKLVWIWDLVKCQLNSLI